MENNEKDYFDILLNFYDLKLKQRHEHRDNNHKWMTFYSVAIGAILVAFGHFQNDKFLSLILILFGLITSCLFHLSCKGYKHWTNHTINEIWKLEAEILKELKKKATARVLPVLS